MTRRMLACAVAALALVAAPNAAPAAHAATAEVAPAARADWSAGPVALGAGFTQAGGSDRVREVQRRLGRLGYRPGPADGLYGPRTEEAAQRFQERNGLAVDAVVGSRTLRALRTSDEAVRAARAERTAPAPAVAQPGPVAPPEPAPRQPAPVVQAPGGGLAPEVFGFLFAAMLLGAAARLRLRGREPLTVRGDEIVATSAVRELAARSEAGFGPRFSRPELPSSVVEERV
jgi:hypothetical protein